MTDQPPTIPFETFAQVDLRVARILEARDHPNADKLIVLRVDLGTEERQIVAGLKGHYEADDLVGKTIVVVTNLAPRNMRGEPSQGMLLAAVTPDQARVVLLTAEQPIDPGTKVS